MTTCASVPTCAPASLRTSTSGKDRKHRNLSNAFHILHNRLQNGLYRVSFLTGCHQLQERSFFICERQMPLCARCTGILVGLTLFPVSREIHGWLVPIVLFTVFLTDSLTQLFRLRKSNNLLRFTTGIGFSVAILSLLGGAMKWLSNIRP